MTKLFELYAPFAPERSASVVAVQSPIHGFCISRHQLLHAKRKLAIPDWASVHLRFNGVDKQLVVVSFDSEEVLTCAG